MSDLVDDCCPFCGTHTVGVRVYGKTGPQWLTCARVTCGARFTLDGWLIEQVSGE